ncbi:MAG: two-component system response regulator, partial [Pseudomonadales bacterium]|nr:two-component system response regulator [Pseudomonadales bacterium]
NIAEKKKKKWDGSGYPRHLKNENIPIEARIVAIADVFDALLSPRPYKEAFSMERSLEILKKDAGSHFDPHLIEIFFRLVQRGIVDKIIAKYPYT